MPVPTLVIGMGGSGAWTTAHVKRQLLDTYNNKIPDNVSLLVIDTANEALARIGPEFKDREMPILREAGMGVGLVTLDNSEYAHIGGNVFELTRKIDQGKDRKPPDTSYEHFYGWYQADELLTSIGEGGFNLEKGAGMFRQLGRMAVFNDVLNPSTSSLARMLENKLTTIASNMSGTRTITVMFCASLAGGTGAGLFIDVPHLVRRFAKARNVDIRLRAFLYLPDVFQQDLQNQDINTARGRSFACMRELKRFLMQEDYEYGYPMHYQDPSTGIMRDIYRTTNKGNLYDFVYLIDGQHNQVNEKSISEGASVVVADAITNFIDNNYGNFQQQYDQNAAQKVIMAQRQTGKKSYISAMGSYSIILPATQILEGWAYDVALKLVQLLIPGVTDKNQKFMKRLHYENPENPQMKPHEELVRLFQQETPMIASLSSGDTLEIRPFPLWREVLTYYQDMSDDRHFIKEQLQAYLLGHWVSMLVPSGLLEQDPQIEAISRDTANTLEEEFAAITKRSDQMEQARPESDVDTIDGEARQYIDRQLGRVRPGGGRTGSRYEKSLERFSNIQLQRFRQYLQVYLQDTLNGTGKDDAILRKNGRLGWALLVLQTLRNVFGEVYELLDDIRSSSGDMGEHDRVLMREQLEIARDEMFEKSSERGFLGRIKPAVDAQKQYIEQVQVYVDFHRKEIAREIVTSTVRELRDEATRIYDALDVWREVLGTDQYSLYNELVVGRNRVDSELNHARNYPTHRLITDQQWLGKRFEDYIEDNHIEEEMANAWNWKVSSSGGDIQVTPHLSVPGDDADQKTFNTSNQRDWYLVNRNRLMKVARHHLTGAIERLTLISYLADRESPRDVGRELAKNSGHLLTMPQNIPQMITGFALLAREDDSTKNSANYLAQVRQSFAESNQIGSPEAIDSVPCEDRFRLTLISHADLLPFKQLSAYQRCRQIYFDLPYDARRLNHIFPAEINAVEYEEQLSPVLEQETRALSDRVCLLLEDSKRFLDFLLLYAYEIIREERDEQTGTDALVYTFNLYGPPSDTYSNSAEVYRLCESGQHPSLMDAMLQYVNRRVDYVNPNRSLPPDTEMTAYLRAAREDEMRYRIQNGLLAVHYQRDDSTHRIQYDSATDRPLTRYDDDLRDWIEVFMPPMDGDDQAAWTQADQEIFEKRALLVATHDRLYEQYREIKSWLPEARRNLEQAKSGHQNQDSRAVISRQEEYDLYSVMIMALKHEVEQRREMMHRYYRDFMDRV